VRVTGWSNGSPLASGAGYGLKISRQDRDRFFDRVWTHIVLDIPGEGSVEIGLSRSFWGTCTELRSASIGRWLVAEGLAPWPTGNPPAVTMVPAGEGRFTLSSAPRFG
jgi:hypothetical protein